MTATINIYDLMLTLVFSILSFVAFFVTICYHTIYATPWIFPPLALYGLDMLLRFFRYRIKDATLAPISNQLTIVCFPLNILFRPHQVSFVDQRAILHRWLDSGPACSTSRFLQWSYIRVSPIHNPYCSQLDLMSFKCLLTRYNSRCSCCRGLVSCS